MKISKASWMILAAGVFIIALIGLGMTRSGQMKEQSMITEELSLTAVRLGNLHTTESQAQINELEEQLKDTLSQADEAKEKMKQAVISVDVADKFYEIAGYYGVTVNALGTSTVMESRYDSINCETISLHATITGDLTDVIDFVIGLNNNYATGYVQSAQFSIGDETDENPTSVSIQMIVYSYKGSS